MEDLFERAVQIARARYPGRPEVARAVSLRLQTGDVPVHVLAGHLVAGPRLADALVSPEVRQDMHLAAFIDRVAQALPVVPTPGQRDQRTSELIEETRLLRAATEKAALEAESRQFQATARAGFARIVESTRRGTAMQSGATDPPPPQARELKRRALIEQHVARWPSIERDLKDASVNGLREAAGCVRRGWWREGAALEWARVRGKLIEAQRAAASVFRMGR